MPNMLISLNFKRPLGQLQWRDISGVASVVRFLEGVMSGHREGEDIKFSYNDSIAANSFASYASQAASLLVAATATGAVGAAVGATTVTVTAAGGDTATMTALAAAIRANATAGQIATATSQLAQLTCTTVAAGATVNIWNITFTGIGAAAIPTVAGQFSVGATDTACALNLANSINQHPALAARITAVSVAGVVFIGRVDQFNAARPSERITTPTATTITIQAPACVPGTRCMVFASVPGLLGNEMRVAASGTGMTAATNGAAGLCFGGGGGGLPAFTQDVVL